MRHHLFRISIVLMFVVGGLFVPAAPATAQAENLLSPEPYLNADGTLNIPADVSGNLNLDGWDVTLDAERGAVFAPATAPAAATVGAWSSLGGPGTGLNSNVRAIVANRGKVYAGGTFSNAGTDPDADFIAKYGRAWSSLGGADTGLNNTVWTILIHGGTLYAGGFFTDAGGDADADHIAKFENGAWSSLGGPDTGLDFEVFALLMDGNTLYAGGFFKDAGGDADADHIAKFENGAWSSLGGPGTGLGSAVFALALDGSTLYAAGYFLDAGGDANADHVARFNGVAWSALGGPGSVLNNTVTALQFEGNTLYAGGWFTNAGGDADADYIAKFESGAWSSLGGPGTGLNNAVYTMVLEGDTLFAGGDFLDAGGDVDADRIAKFEGGVWSSLGGPGTGLNNIPLILDLDAGTLYAGGMFSDAGGDADADFIAQYGLYATPAISDVAVAASEPGDSCAIDPNGGACKVGDVWVNIPAGALPASAVGCRVVIEDAGTASELGLSLNERVYDVRVVCENGSVSVFTAPITVCIRPQDGVTSGKQLFHNHAGAGFNALPASSARAGHVCGTTSQLSLFVIGGLFLPETGFAPGVVTQLPVQPAERAYASTDLILSIPSLNVQTAIVGVPQSADGWDVTWLGQQAGYLYGTAFPTWAGNTVITAHVWDANNNPGPFANLADLQHGDTIEIAAFGQTYVYEVRDSASLRPTDTRTAFASSQYDILTLITCEGFDARTGEYLARRVVTAVLVEIR